jgi:hypothetical protein
VECSGGVLLMKRVCTALRFESLISESIYHAVFADVQRDDKTASRKKEQNLRVRRRV